MSDEWQNRMETKIDKLVEAVVLMSTLHGSVERLDERVEKVEDDIQKIQERMPLVDLMLKTVGKIGAGVLIILGAGAIGSFFVFGG